MTSFWADLVHTDNGFTCSDSGFRALSNAQECSGAVSYAKTFNSKARIDSTYMYVSDRPKGCYIWGSGTMYFNSHPTGGRSTSVASICWKGNKLF